MAPFLLPFALCLVPILSLLLAWPVNAEAPPADPAPVSVEDPAEEAGESDGSVHFAETVTVSAASRRGEKALEAPAAVTLVTASEAERQSTSGQLPKLLEHTPGVELTQTGLYDFNLNIRGFNGPLTRRIAVLIDGRDPSMPFLGAQEWSTLGSVLNEIETLELVRGPSAAVYGPNASSGVLSVVTRPPGSSTGGLLRATAGELDTLNFDLRQSGQLGEGRWKLLASHRSSETFARSRKESAEYATLCTAGEPSSPCLPRELADPAEQIEGFSGSLRFDTALGPSLDLTLEAGGSAIDGVTVLSNLGRVGLDKSEQTFVRSRLVHPRWQISAALDRRDAPTQTLLGSGANLALDSRRTTFEARTHHDFSDDLRWIAGAWWRRTRVDSFDPSSGRQSLLFEPAEDDAVAVFTQLDWHLARGLKLVVAGRWDDSELFYEDELSPKASLVWSPSPRHTLRLSYNEAFQAANFAEKLAQVDVAPGLDLRALEAFCAPFAVDCGFAGAPTRRMASGNPELGVERLRAIELGYRVLVGESAFLTVDLYRSENRDFITDLLPELTTPLGDLNPVFGPYRPPSGLPAEAADALLAALGESLGSLLPFLSNNFDGDPILLLFGFGSFGEVRTQGAEISARYVRGRRWSFDASYAYFDFELDRSLPGLDQVLSPNAPEHQLSAGVVYTGERLRVGLSGRFMESFFWSSGVFSGEVPSFTTFDLSASWRWNERVEFHLNIANLFDHEHFEAFGGDSIGRRALGSVGLRW